MAKEKILFEWAFGTGYQVQPGHKPNIVPSNYLEAFCNVKPDDFDSVADFCKGYGFDPEWIRTGEDLLDGFAKVHRALASIIKKILVRDSSLTFREVDVINGQLANVHPRIGLLYPDDELWRRETNLQLHLLRSSEGGDPDVNIRIHGHPEKTRQFHVDIVQVVPAASKDRWRLEVIDHGISEVVERFADQADWEAIKPLASNLVIGTGSKLTYSRERGIQRITHRLVLGNDNQIQSRDLVARMVSTSPTAHLSYMFWQAVKESRHLGEYRLCKVCGNLHSGRSANYCSKSACKNEWPNIKNRRRYATDPSYRAHKKQKKSKTS